MTSLDISSVRDFDKARLRKILLDFYFFTTNPIGPTDSNKIELDSDYDKLIILTNKNLFKEFNGKEFYLFSKKNNERPKAYVYVKVLNLNKFSKKIGEHLIEFRVIKKQPVIKKSLTVPADKNALKSKSKHDFKRSKINPVIFKSKILHKDQMKVNKMNLEKMKVLERKIRYGFGRKNYSDQSKKPLKDLFVPTLQQINTTSVISRTSTSIFSVPPNWTYCYTYELDLNRILNPTDLFLEIDVRLIEFLEIDPKKAQIVKTLPLSDLLADQFLDVVIIKDLKKFYLQMIESINQLDTYQTKNSSILNLNKNLMNSNESMHQELNEDLQISEESKNIDAKEISKESTIVSNTCSAEQQVGKMKIEKRTMKKKLSKLVQKFKKILFLSKMNKITEKSRRQKKKPVEADVKMVTELKVTNTKLNDINLSDKVTYDKLNVLSNSKTDSTKSSTGRENKKSFFSKFLKFIKPIKKYTLKKRKSTNSLTKTDRKKSLKHKIENAAFLSIELQLGAKIELSKEKRLIKCFNHIDMFVVLALDGKKSYLNLRELRNQTSWHALYTAQQIFVLNQSKMHQTINSLEDAICRTIAIAKIYAKYARIKNFCYLNSSINDLLYQNSLSSKQPWFPELYQLLEDYLFENLEMIFKAEMPASLMTMYKYNYSKYGEFLFDHQVQLILGVIAIKSSFGSTQSENYLRLTVSENTFFNPDSEDTFKEHSKEPKNQKFQTNELLTTNSIGEAQISKESLSIENQSKENRSSKQPLTNTNLNLLGSMARGFERSTQVWMQYMETKKPEESLEELVHFSRALKNFCTGLVRVFNRKHHLIVKRLLLHHQKKGKPKTESNLNRIARKYSAMPRLPRIVIQSLINLHLIIDSRILNWIPFSLKMLVDKLTLPVDYDEATDVAKRNAIFQASPYKDIYNSLRVTIEKLQSLHNEQIQVQVTVQTIQGWFPLNVTQAWVAEEIQRVELECATWDEFFKELVFIKSDFKLDKMEKLNLITDKERQIKEEEFKDFLNDYVANRLNDLVSSTINEISYASEKLNFLSKTNDQIKEVDSNVKINISDVKNLANFKTILTETENQTMTSDKTVGPLAKTESDLKNENVILVVNQNSKMNESTKETKETEKFKEPTEQIKQELDKLIKSQSITSQLADKLIMNDDRKEKMVQNVLEALKKEFSKETSSNIKIEIDKSKLEDKLKEELEKIKLEKEIEEREKRMQLEEKIKEEFNAFKQGKSDRFNKRLQKFNHLKPIELINLMESCYENLIAFVSWPHAIFPAKTAKEIVYCIDLIAVALKKFYQKLEQKSRSNFENVYKDSLERFIVKIRIVNNALMENSFVDPDLRMNVVEWTEYQEKSWRGVVIGLECSKQIDKFCILKETKTDRKLRMLPRRKLIVNRKKNK